MKRLISIFLATVMVASMTACGKTEKPKKENEQLQQTEPTQPEEIEEEITEEPEKQSEEVSFTYKMMRVGQDTATAQRSDSFRRLLPLDDPTGKTFFSLSFLIEKDGEATVEDFHIRNKQTGENLSSIAGSSKLVWYEGDLISSEQLQEHLSDGGDIEYSVDHDESTEIYACIFTSLNEIDENNLEIVCEYNKGDEENMEEVLTYNADLSAFPVPAIGASVVKLDGEYYFPNKTSNGMSSRETAECKTITLRHFSKPLSQKYPKLQKDQFTLIDENCKPIKLPTGFSNFIDVKPLVDGFDIAYGVEYDSLEKEDKARDFMVGNVYMNYKTELGDFIFR